MTPHTVPHTVRAHNRRVDPVLCLLGAAATVTEGERRPLRVRPKALALLVRLALVAGLQDRAELAELLFAEANDPRDSLRWHLSHLRKQLPASVRDGFAGEGGSISLDVPTDAGIFRANVARVMRDPAVPDARRVLGLYRGSLCSGLSVNASAEFDNWLYVQEDELRRRFRGATVAFARHAIAHGRGQDAVEPLRRLVAVDPYHEEAHVLLIDGLDAAGRTDDARHAYDRYERIVRDELHAEPRPELVRRYESRRSAGRVLPLSELVPLRDVTMHVVEWPGPDPPIVAIHGSLGHAWRMSPVGESLASAARLIAVDLRGHGFSDKPPSGYRLHNHLHDLRQLIATLRLDHPILFGFSIGGAIATFLAADDDVGAAGLVLYDAVVGDRGFVEGASVVVERRPRARPTLRRVPPVPGLVAAARSGRRVGALDRAQLPLRSRAAVRRDVSPPRPSRRARGRVAVGRTRRQPGGPPRGDLPRADRPRHATVDGRPPIRVGRDDRGSARGGAARAARSRRRVSPRRPDPSSRATRRRRDRGVRAERPLLHFAPWLDLRER